jgi:hypothetical protein
VTHHIGVIPTHVINMDDLGVSDSLSEQRRQGRLADTGTPPDEHDPVEHGANRRTATMTCG